MKKLKSIIFLTLALCFAYFGFTWAANGLLPMSKTANGSSSSYSLENPSLKAHGLLAEPLRAGRLSILIPLDEKQFLIIERYAKPAKWQLYNIDTAKSKLFTVEGLEESGIATATLLKTGDILLTGHHARDEKPFSILADPVSGKSTITSPMKAARSGYEATLLEDGRVLFSGGEFPKRLPSGGVTAGMQLGILELFDPRTKEYTRVNSETEPGIFKLTTKLTDGRVLFMPGMGKMVCDKGKEDCILPTKIESFDPASQTVSDGGQVPNEPFYETLTPDKKMPVFYKTANPLPNGKVLLSSNLHLDIYDPQTHQIQILKERFTCQNNDPKEQTMKVMDGRTVTLPTVQNSAFPDFAFNLPDSKILYLVGRNDGGSMMPASWPSKCNNIFIFDPGNQKLTGIGSAELPGYAYSAVLVGNRLFVVKDKFVYELTGRKTADSPTVMKYLQDQGAQKKLNDELLGAINNQDLKRIRELIDQGADINYKTATESRYSYSLLENMNVPATLNYAMRAKNEDIILFLLAKGVQHEPDKLVSKAASLGMERFLRHLIQEGLKPETLHEGLLHARTEQEVDLLVKVGADPNVVRLALLPEGTTPTELQTLLKEIHAKHSKEYSKKLMLKGLNAAIENKKTNQIQVLLASEPNLGVYRAERGSFSSSYTPLAKAAERGDIGLVKLLVPKDIGTDEAAVAAALSKASAQGHQEIVKFLTEKGTNPNALESKNYTPSLMSAACSGQLDTVRYLLSKGASPRVSGGYLGNRSALHCVISEAHRFPDKAAEIASLLILAGADVNEREEGLGWTPLHFAANSNRPEIAKILIQAGARMDVRDRDGKTPLERKNPHGSQTQRFLECVRELQQEDGVITTNELKRCDPSPIQIDGHDSSSNYKGGKPIGSPSAITCPDGSPRPVSGSCPLLPSREEQLKQSAKKAEDKKILEEARKEAARKEHARVEAQRKQIRSTAKCTVLNRNSSLQHPYLRRAYEEITRNFNFPSAGSRPAIVSFKFYRHKDPCEHKAGHVICPGPKLEEFDLIPGRVDNVSYSLNPMPASERGYVTEKKVGIKVSSGNKRLDDAAENAVFAIRNLQDVPSQYNNKCFEIALPLQAGNHTQSSESIRSMAAGIASEVPKSTSPSSDKPAIRVTYFPAQGCHPVSKSAATRDPAIKAVYDAFKANQASSHQDKKTLVSVAFSLHRIRKVGDNALPHRAVKRYTFKQPDIGPSLKFMNYSKPGYMLAKVYGLNAPSGNEALDKAAFKAIQDTGPIMNYPEDREGECFNIPYPLE